MGGGIFLAFPSENTVNFPSRQGSLNFYDDPTHIYMPKFSEVMKRLIRDNGMSVDYCCKNYRPFPARFIGGLMESFHPKKSNFFTWAFYGFETIIWAHKK